MFRSSQKKYPCAMPEIICINCFAHVFVNGDSLVCLKCEELPKADLIPTAANPEQPTYAQMQTLINETIEVRRSVNQLRWFMWGMWVILIIYFVAVGVKVNLSPT